MSALSAIGQIALHVTDANRAEHYYEDTLQLTKLYRFGELVFFDCGGVRLMLEGGHPPAAHGFACCVYYRVAGIAARYAEMKARGVAFDDEPHMIARMTDHELWMVFFKDPDGNQFALMEERR
jgi:methylmalonyl-CoA/ethylmalonyl-CoA epimerase